MGKERKEKEGGTEVEGRERGHWEEVGNDVRRNGISINVKQALHAEGKGAGKGEGVRERL